MAVKKQMRKVLMPKRPNSIRTAELNKAFEKLEEDRALSIKNSNERTVVVKKCIKPIYLHGMS